MAKMGGTAIDFMYFVYKMRFVDSVARKRYYLPLCQIVCQKNCSIKKSAEKHSFLCLLRAYLRVIER